MKLYSLFHLRDSGRTHISLWCSMLQGVSFISFPQPASSMSVVLGGCLCFHNTLSQSPENSCGLVAFSWALDTGRWRMQWWNGLWKDKNLILVEKKRAMSFLLHYTLVYWNSVSSMMNFSFQDPWLPMQSDSILFLLLQGTDLPFVIDLLRQHFLLSDIVWPCLTTQKT